MTNVPTLPKETAYLYARFNKIKKIRTKDFADIGKSENHLAPLFVPMTRILEVHEQGFVSQLYTIMCMKQSLKTDQLFHKREFYRFTEYSQNNSRI